MQKKVQKVLIRQKNFFFKLLYLVILLFYGCKQDSGATIVKEEPKSINSVVSSSDADLAYRKVIDYGDTNSYYELTTFYLEAPPETGLFAALVMAHKYNYKPAYYDVYRILGDSFNQQGRLSKNEMGEGNYELAINHLIKGASLGNKQCIATLNRLYPEIKVTKK